jgi:hypothetical protein
VPEPVRAKGDPDALLRVAESIRKTMRPASQDQIEAWVAELWVITAHAKSDEMTLELMLKAYTKRLSEYPADIVREVLLVRVWKFFPTWADLAEALDAMIADRRAMLAACEVPRETVPAVDPDREVLTPERRAEIAAELGLPVIAAKVMQP